MNCVDCGDPIEPDDYFLNVQSSVETGWQHAVSQMVGCNAHFRAIAEYDRASKHINGRATPHEGFVEEAIDDLDSILRELSRGRP